MNVNSSLGNDYNTYDSVEQDITLELNEMADSDF